MVWIPRDNKEANVARIAALQPWLERGEMHIVKDINNLTELILELTRFPKYRRDDIIDALADQLALIPMFSGVSTTRLPSLTSKCGDARLGLMACTLSPQLFLTTPAGMLSPSPRKSRPHAV